MATVIHEFSAPYWVQTPLGEGRAILLFDYGFDDNPKFMVHLNDGRFRVVNMIDCAGCENPTEGIERPEQPCEKSFHRATAPFSFNQVPPPPSIT